MTDSTQKAAVSPWVAVFPLALAQFVASYACTNMNVAINSIAKDIGTDVSGVQTAITLFTLTMAALMIPGSKLTDRWGRRRCFVIGLVVYGAGALLAAFAQGLTVLVIGYSLLEGVGSALMIPPIYILITVLFSDVQSRAKYFGAVSGAAGIGAAAGPLIGGLITTGISWRASFGLQVAIVLVVIYLTRGVPDDHPAPATSRFDVMGTILSAAGLVLIVIGVLVSRTYGWFRSRADFEVGNTVLIHQGGVSPVWLFIAAGVLLLAWFYLHVRAVERKKREPLLSTRLFRNHTANLGLTTQLIQWLALQGTSFVVSVFLQTVRGFSAVETGLALTPSTIGLLLSSAAAGRMAQRRAQRTLIWVGFAGNAGGIVLLLLFARATSNILTFVPGLLLIGLAIGIMLTASVNVVQSAFPEKDQGEISGLSRSISNLGSSFGTALVGSVLVSTLVKGNKHFVLALVTMLVFTLFGLVAALRLPRQEAPTPAPT